MRTLHPVQMHETFVASGEYLLYAPGFSTEIVERWSIHQLPDATWFVRFDSDWRADRGDLVLAEALVMPPRAPGDRCRVERIDLERYVAAPGKPTTRISAHFSFFDAYLNVGYAQPGAPERGYAELSVDAPYAVAPRWRYLHLLTGFAAAGGVAGVERPTFLDFPLEVGAASPAFIAGSVRFERSEAETLAVGLQTVAADVYTMRYADQPDRPVTLWLDRHGVLLRAKGGHYEVSLVQYARRPEPK